MSLVYQEAATYAELLERLGPGIEQHIEEKVAAAPPLTDEAAELIARMFAGAGARIRQRREQRDAA